LVDTDRKDVAVNANAVESNQIRDTCKSQQICKPLSDSKRVLQISTNLKNGQRIKYQN
jgi:hypothetical protein